MKCRKCTGTGQEERQRMRWVGGGKLGFREEWTVTVDCARCEGSGEDPHPWPLAEDAIVSVLEIEGHVVDAPGFTLEQFTAAVDRAKREQLRTAPGVGCVMVMSGSDDARYAVTRQACDCMAGQTHRYCKHRALAIYLQDVQGVDVMRVPTIGFSPRGVSLTTGRKPAAKAVA